MNPRKKLKIEELLKREISNSILYHMNDPRTGFISVTGVELSEDQRSAKVRVTVRGEARDIEETLHVLSRARGFLQARIADHLDLRYTPVLGFEEDEDVLKARRLEKLIDDARKDDLEFRA
jgi:ribosome-binding factor A